MNCFMDISSVGGHVVSGGELVVGAKRTAHDREVEGNNLPFSNRGDECQIQKRKRVLSDPDMRQLSSVTERVIRWLTENPKQRPRTTTALLNVLGELSTYTVQVDETIVFFHLVMNQVLELTVDGRYRANPNIDPERLTLDSLSGFVTISEASSDQRSPLVLCNFSEEFSAALLKVCQWVCTTPSRDLPRTQAALMKTLRQLCYMRRSVPPSQVLHVLLNNGFLAVSLDHGQSIEYRLPNLPGRHFQPPCFS